jgi:hypothetical protein
LRGLKRCARSTRNPPELTNCGSGLLFGLIDIMLLSMGKRLGFCRNRMKLDELAFKYKNVE